MKKWLITGCIGIIFSGFTIVLKRDESNDPETISKAINKSLPLLQSSSHIFLENAGGCHSCHHQALTALNLSMAKERGFTVNDTSLREILNSIVNRFDWRSPLFVENDDPTAIVMSSVYDLWALSSNHYRSNKKIDLLIKNLIHRQTKEGCWVSSSRRPPLEYYSFSATALMYKALQNYAPSEWQRDVSLRLERARSWLINTRPETTEEKVFQLLGLTWAKADPKIIQQQAKKLLAAQHNDGGWSQLDSLESDAYATGQSLYSLNQCGLLPIEDPAFQKGISFLLNTQFEDGSWKVVSRSFPVIPFVETKFPHGKSQFISAAGTNWATIALLLTRK